MSGTGKSTVLAELGRRGHRVVDTDGPGWSEEVATADGATEQLWLEEPVSALLAERTAGTLFVSGCAANQVRFYDRFDAVVLLSVPEDVLLDRIATRTANGFGRSAADRARILADLRAVEPLLRRGATAEIDGRRPVAEVADEVEGLADGDPAPRPA
jgi:AAA domain